ncbi:hypothetical protein D9M68_423940 [compost metagenome]
MAGAQQVATQVDCDRTVEYLERHIERGGVVHDRAHVGRVGVHQVDAAERIQRGRHQRGDRGLVADVALHAQRALAPSLNPLRKRVCAVAVEIANHHCRAFHGQSLSGGGAYS